MRTFLGVVGFLLLASPVLGAASFETEKIDTGLEIVMMESKKVPLVTIVLCSKAGGFTETPQTNGLTHLWEHMFFKGNKNLPDQEAFKRRIRQLGISYNGDTSAEKVRYYFTLPSVFLEEGLQFMADAISTPLLEEVELKKERKVVMDEYDRSAASPSFDFRNLFREMIYGDQAYQRDPLGHRYLIEKATREQLLQIKKEVFVPSNSAILVSGDFDKNNLMRLVKKHFGSWKDPTKNWQPVTRPALPNFPKSLDFVMARKNVRNASLRIVFEGPKARQAPMDTFAADALISLLSHRSGKFYKKFIDSGKTYGAGLSYHTQSQAGEISVYASTDPDKVAAIKKELMDEIPLWSKPGYFTDEQLEDVRRSLLIGHKREMNSPSAYIKTLAFWWAVTGLDYYKDYLPNLRKTSFKDVQGFVNKWMVGKPSISGTLMSPEDAKKHKIKVTSEILEKKFLSNYRKSSNERS